ncbi:MAG: hypothetical protein GX442_18460 [Candidatus Riflebacteria bacterium]|nr:hypothetical protein [Candidatus Riflebacteria bacterium]
MRITGIRWLACFILTSILFLGSGVAPVSAEDLSLAHRFPSAGDTQPPDWRLQLEFSRPVSVLDISRMVTLTTNGKPSLFRIVNATDLAAEPSSQPLSGERTIFILAPKAPATVGASCTVFVGKGLPAADKKSRLAADLRIRFQVSDSARLLEVTPYYSGADNHGAKLLVSSDMNAGDLKAQIRVLPPVGRLKVERIGGLEGNFRFQLSGNFDPGKRYRVQNREARGIDVDTRLEPASFTFVAEGPDPEIVVETDRSVLELKSRQLLPVTLTNVSQVQCEITRVPALFAPEYADLTIFARTDAPRPRTSSKMGPSDAEEARIGEAIPQIETRQADNVRLLASLKALPSFPNGVPLAHFLGEFTSAREVFVNQGKPGKLSRLSLPLGFRTDPAKGGAILLKLLNEGSEEGSTARLLQVTDLSITYKFSDNELLLWVTSLETGKPVADVALLLITKDDGRFALGKTDANGLLLAREGTSYPVLRVQNDQARLESGTFKVSDVVHAVAATADDSCFLAIDSNRFRPYQVTQAPPGKVTLPTRNGHVFTERGIYKPGETVHWKATLRQYRNNEVVAPAGEKVTVQIVNSRDDAVFDQTYELNEYGTASDSFKLSPNAPLGQYTLKVLISKKPAAGIASATSSLWERLLGKTTEKTDDDDDDLKELVTTGFQVQFFEPPRHFVEIETEVKTRDNTAYVGRKFTENYLECRIRGKYYTGGFVKHAKTRWTATLVPVSRDIAGQENYLFGSDAGDRTLIETGESLLDKDGQMVVHLPMDKSLNGGLYGIEMSATVLDVDARPATKVETFNPKPAINVGMMRLGNYVRQGEEYTVDTVALHADGKPVTTGVMRLDIFRKRYFYTQKRDEDGNIYYRWDSGWVRALFSEQPVKDGHSSFAMAFADGGEYRLQANYTTPDGEFSASQFVDVGYSYSWYEDEEGDDDENSKRRSDSEIVLATSRSVAAVGDTVKFDFGVPRSASHALVTCERDGIYEHRVIPLTGRRGSFEMKVGPQARPNVFFTVTIPCGRGDFPVYKSQVDQMIPRVFHGITSLRVENQLDSLGVVITESAADSGKGTLKAHPGETRSLTFQARDGQGKGKVCEMAVCVVDEAVLSLTGFVTPVLDRLAEFVLPLTVFSGDLRLSVVSQELYKLFATHLLTGGDLGAGGLASDLALRKDFRPVAYWNPALLTDAEGKATITFTLPDSTTAYRIYVVALDKRSAFCSTERQMVVSKEFYLQPGLPRFLTAGDKALAPVTANNKTDAPGEATLEVAESSNVTARLREPTVRMGPLSNTVAKLELEADNGAGDARLVFAGKMGPYGDAIEALFPIVPRFAVVRRQKIGHFTDKAETTLEFPAGVADVPAKDRQGVLKATLGLSVTPWSKIAPGLKYLLQYPYGCVEQTSSGIIPLAGLRKLVAEGLVPGITLAQVDKFLTPGVSRLLKMQTRSGGFAYWMGERRPSWWGTQYAVFALTAAQEAGCEVPQADLDRAVKYISDGLFGKEGIDEPVHYSIFELSAVNLARHGGLTAANLDVLMKKYFIGSSNEAKALLVWADALIKKSPAAKLKGWLAEIEPKCNGTRRSWYDSSVREVAICLLAQLAVDPDNRKADDLAGDLLANVEPEGRWYSTADTGWALLALGRYFERKAPPSDKPATVTVTAAGGPAREVTVGKLGAEIELDAEALLQNPKVALSVKPEGMINWNLSYAYPDPASRASDLDHGFLVEKTIKNLNGEKEIRVGDLVQVTVEFEDNRTGPWWRSHYYQYLALEDPIPAGFLVINAALKTEQPVRPSDDEDEAAGEDEDEWYSSWEDGCYLLRPDFFEMRDDRVMAFRNSLWSGRFRFTYFARAICEGTFFMRPTRVSLMYDSDTYGMTPGLPVHILPAR